MCCPAHAHTLFPKCRLKYKLINRKISISSTIPTPLGGSARLIPFHCPCHAWPGSMAHYIDTGITFPNKKLPNHKFGRLLQWPRSSRLTNRAFVRTCGRIHDRYSWLLSVCSETSSLLLASKRSADGQKLRILIGERKWRNDLKCNKIAAICDMWSSFRAPFFATEKWSSVVNPRLR